MVGKLTNDETLCAYDEIAPFYEEYSLNRKEYLESVEHLILKQLNSQMRLLDIGSGDGRRLAKILEESGIKDVHSVEPSSEMAKICREKTGIPVHETFGENISELNIGEFDVVTAMWNVLGHIPTSEARLKTLENIRLKLKDGGKVIIDVNNRHNAASYGFWNVLKRRVIDFVNFKTERGDAEYDWKIGEKSFRSRGHLFTPREVENLVRKAGLKIIESSSVDYGTGMVSTSNYKGQLFFVLGKNE